MKRFVTKFASEEMKRRKILSDVALGNIPPDTTITHGTLFNVFTREFVQGQSIWIKDGIIAYAGPDQNPLMDDKTAVVNAEGMVLVPGLIEGHTHLNRCGIEEYVKHVIPSGVTTVVMETMELGAIAGKEGIEYFVKGLKGQPIRFYYTIAALCGLTSAEEINAPANKELLPFLKDPNCLGIGEIYWGNIFVEGRQGERVRELASIGLDLGKRVEGHSAGATGKKLQSYTHFGVSSCHEPITEDEVLERLRLGYWVMIREGAIRKELPGVKGIFGKKIDYRRLILVTDGMDAEAFMQEGYLDASVKKALKLGVPPEIAYQMVTINVAEHFHIDHLIGSLSPGKMADIVFIPSPDEFSPKLIMCAGQIIFKDGRNTVNPRKVNFRDFMVHTVKVQDFKFPSIPKKGKVRVIELVTDLVTKERIVNLEDPEESKDLLMLLAIDRMGSGGSFMGFLKGFGLKEGAYGSTTCWDTIDMTVVGCDPQSIKTVIERLKEIGGGGVYAIGNEIIAESSAPICGVYSQKPMAILREEVKKIEDSMKKNGVRWQKPVLAIDVLTTPAIPHLRITHHGYVRLKDRVELPLEVSSA
jgi:adenine deaminase